MSNMLVIAAFCFVSVIIGLLSWLIVKLNADFLRIKISAPGVEIDAEVKKNQ